MITSALTGSAGAAFQKAKLWRYIPQQQVNQLALRPVASGVRRLSTVHGVGGLVLKQPDNVGL
jgi:hypothetical protein